MDADLARLARDQGGAISHKQAREAGWSSTLRRRIGQGEWRTLGNGVMVPVSAEVDDVLAHAAVALSLRGPWAFAGPTGLALMNVPLPPALSGAPMVAVGRGGVRARVLGRLPIRVGHAELARRRIVEGYPVLPIEICVRQTAAMVDEETLTTVIEKVVRQKRTTLPALAAACGRGRPGSGPLRRVLEVLMHDSLDKWVRVLARELRRRGIKSEPEWWLRHEGRAHPFDLKVSPQDVVEVDDWETHGLIANQDRDRIQDRWARRAGIDTFRTTPREIRDHLDRVCDDIEERIRH